MQQQDDGRLAQSVAQSRGASLVMWGAAFFLVVCFGVLVVWLVSFTGIDLQHALLAGLVATLAIIVAMLSVLIANRRQNARKQVRL